jgi:hypothetical protein
MRHTATVVACTGLLLAGAARADETAPEAIDKLVLPASKVACRFTAASLPTGFTLELRPGVAYATVSRADAIQVDLPVAAKPEPVVVKVVAQKFRLEGVVAAASIPLQAARPFVAGDLFVPGPQVPIAWTSAKAGQVDIAIDLREEAKATISGVTGPLKATRPCQDLGVKNGPDFDRFRAVGTKRGEPTHVFAGEGPIPISAKPGARAAAQLLPTPANPGINDVVIIQKKKPWSRVAYDTQDFLIVGWVRDSDIKATPPAAEIGEAYGVGGLGLSGTGVGGGPDAGAFACKQSVPLIAEVGVERLIVGSIEAGANLTVDSTVGDLLPVRFADLVSFEAAAGAQFLVRRSDVEGCPGFAAPAQKRKAR